MGKKNLSRRGEYKVRLVLLDKTNYAKIYDNEGDINKLYYMLDILEAKTGEDILFNYIKYKYLKADFELRIFIKSIKRGLLGKEKAR